MPIPSLFSKKKNNSASNPSLQSARNEATQSNGVKATARKNVGILSTGEDAIASRTRELVSKRARALCSPRSPNVQLSPSSQRKRPRGSEGGKSIHKAAEAPTFRGPSPAPTNYRKSLGLEKPSTDINSLGQRRIVVRKTTVRQYRETMPVATRSPSLSSASPLEGTPDFTDATTPEPQVARKTASTTKSKTPRLPPQGVAKKSLWKGKAKSGGSDSQESSSSQESEAADSDNDKSSNSSSSDFDNIPGSSSSIPSPREILSHFGRSKSRVMTHIPSSPDSPSLSKPNNVLEDITPPAHVRSFPNTTETLLSSVQLTTTPPQALVDAFEMLTITTITLQRARRLPFLVRNLRASFRRQCQKLSTSTGDTPSNHNTEALLTFKYTATSGTRHTYQVTHSRRECPLCSIFGQFSTWQALMKHVKWAHDEIEFSFDEVKSSEGDLMPNIIVHLKDDTMDSSYSEPQTIEHQTIIVMRPSGSSTHLDKTSATAAIDYNVKPESGPMDSENPTTSRSSSHPSSSSNKLGSSNEATNSSDVQTPEVMDDLGDIERPSAPPILSLRGLSSSLPIPLTTSDAHPPTAPPLSNLQGPAYPIPSVAEGSSTTVVPKTYRPTGPHLFDHLSPLPLEAFGHRSWFVLDKEEEIFELTDVLDEDKVICALWGRWILLNRSFFIASYIAGVEAFVDEYWLIIHEAAGWGALRAWLLVLVSRRLLNNVEIVQVLKKYNALVGKDKWPKPTAPVAKQ